MQLRGETGVTFSKLKPVDLKEPMTSPRLTALILSDLLSSGAFAGVDYATLIDNLKTWISVSVTVATRFSFCTSQNKWAV